MLGRLLSFISNPNPESFAQAEKRHIAAVTTAHEKKLHRDGFKLDDLPIPDKFLCKISFHLMDDPIIIDSRDDIKLEDIDHDHIIDRSTLTILAKTPNTTILNPFTNKPIKTVIALPNLKAEIDIFVTLMHISAICQFANPEDFMTASDNQDKMIKLGLKRNNMPEEFFPRHLSDRVFTYPVRLNNKYLVDIRDLIKWWQTNNNFLANPCLEDPEKIHSLEFDDELFNKLNVFFFIRESSEFKTQLTLINNQVCKLGSLDGKTAHDYLIAKKFPLDRIPEQYIRHNFSGKIMTHPICIDEHYFVDFSDLLSWFNQAPQNYGINYFTGQLIKSIRYDLALKDNIDAFLFNTELFLETGIVPVIKQRQRARFQAPLNFFMPPLVPPAAQGAAVNLALDDAADEHHKVRHTLLTKFSQKEEF